MKRFLVIGGALIALATFANSADARMMGSNTGMPHMSSSSSSYGIHTSVSSSLGDSRHNNWKKPIDSDGGGPGDPPTKKTGTGTGTGGGTTTASGGYYHGPHYYYNDPNQPSACKGRPKPCP
jgi:hypothetical protein